MVAKVCCDNCSEIATVRAVLNRETYYLCEEHYQQLFNALDPSPVHNERSETERQRKSNGKNKH